MGKLIPTQGVYCIGNGQVAAYLQNACVLQMFGPCYSTPSVASIRLLDTHIQCQTFRVAGSGNYVTTLSKNQTYIGKVIDFAHPSLPALIRVFDLVESLDMTIENNFSSHDVTNLCQEMTLLQSHLWEIPQGTQIFAKCRTTYDIFCQLSLTGNCLWRDNIIQISQGLSVCYFVASGGSEPSLKGFEQCLQNTKTLLHTPIHELWQASMTYWQKQLSQITLTLPSLANGEEMVESVAVALLTQTAQNGGTLAGMFYHLAYGRDMYGVFRGFMALGLYDHARTMLAYLARIYRQKRYMPNASGMGMDCSHCHENDDVEQTGYELWELVFYVSQTQDVTFLKEHLDYACFLLEAQERHLASGMLPFNGDETYIAGGVFPRSGIDHGSMEATSLYIASSLAFLDLAKTHHLLDEAYITSHRDIACHAQSLFAQNFVVDGQVYVNQPKRLDIATIPLHRHGVCHGCHQMTYLTQTKDQGFLCPCCWGRVEAGASFERLTTDCAIWMTVFAHSWQLSNDHIRAALERSLALANDSNFGKDDPQNMVGYHYGVLLYAMAMCGMTKHPMAERVLQTLLSQRLEGSVWVEYYQNGQPNLHACPYRPWESAINLLGILTFIQERNRKNDT